MLLIAPLALAYARVPHVKVHALFSDAAVFQTTDDGGQGSAVTGLAAPHEKVTLSSSNANDWPATTTTADADGAFRFPISRASGGPFDLTISGATSTGSVTAKDVMVGDVFLCSGQYVAQRTRAMLAAFALPVPCASDSVHGRSNMVFPIGSGNDYGHGKGGQSIEAAKTEIKAAHSIA